MLTESTATDCTDYYQRGFTKDGVYTIQLQPSGQQVTVYCELSTGGWTRISRRDDGSENFYRNWNDTKYGFGDKASEHWLGIEHWLNIEH